MPIFRIIQSSTNGSPASVQSTFYEISNQAAYNKFEKFINSNNYTLSCFWLERYNECSNQYELLKYPEYQNN